MYCTFVTLAIAGVNVCSIATVVPISKSPTLVIVTDVNGKSTVKPTLL